MKDNRTLMTCEEVDELLGAYALDALTADEVMTVDTHLAGCPAQAAKAAELRSVARSLYAEAEEMAPPPALRSRVVAAVAAANSARASEPTLFTQRKEQRASSQPSQQPKRPSRPAMAFAALAAGLAVAVAGLLAWNITLRNENSAAPIVTAVHPLLQDTGATAGFVVLFEDNEAAVVGESLPRLDESQAYQVWSVDDLGQPTSLGLMEYDEAGVPTASMPLDAAQLGTTSVAITIEPAAGSEQPTTDPLYVAEL